MEMVTWTACPRTSVATELFIAMLIKNYNYIAIASYIYIIYRRLAHGLKLQRCMGKLNTMIAWTKIKGTMHGY